jgi:hypothetical protein
MTKDHIAALEEATLFLQAQEGESHKGYYGNGWCGSRLRELLEELPLLEQRATAAERERDEMRKAVRLVQESAAIGEENLRAELAEAHLAILELGNILQDALMGSYRQK